MLKNEKDDGACIEEATKWPSKFLVSFPQFIFAFF